MKDSVLHNRTLGRFEIEAQGSTALLEYYVRDGVMVVNHTFVPTGLRGQGLAGILTQVAIETARRERKKIDPQCSYVAAYFKKHPEYTDVLVK